MKKLNYKNFSAAFVALFLAATAISQAEPVVVREPSAPRETSTTTTSTTTTAGTISEFSPDTIIVRSETSPEPIRYTYTKTTTYVDETGAPISRELVKSGLPVTVYYTREGDRMIASKVIVRRTVTDRAPGAAVEERRAPARVIEERERKPPERVIEERKAPAPVIEEKKTTTTTTETK